MTGIKISHIVDYENPLIAIHAIALRVFFSPSQIFCNFEFVPVSGFYYIWLTSMRFALVFCSLFFRFRYYAMVFVVLQLNNNTVKVDQSCSCFHVWKRVSVRA